MRYGNIFSSIESEWNNIIWAELGRHGMSSEPASGVHSVRVKEEPAWTVELARGDVKRERPELHAGREVAVGLVPASKGGVCVKKEEEETDELEHSSHIKEEFECKTESGSPKGDVKHGLYTGHLIEVEIMLNPEELRPPCSASIQPNCGNPQGANKPLNCQIRTKKYAIPSQFSENLKLQSVETRTATNQSPPDSSSSSTNKQIPSEATSYYCNLCMSRCTRKDDLITHIRNHEKKPCRNNIYSCDMCFKKFKYKSYLRIHKRIHTGVKPYSCDLCTRQFAQKNTLTSHRRSHTGEKPYSCDLCPKQFARRYNLVLHTRTHTGDRPFSCEVCMKRFLQPQHLAKHKRSHTGEKPFTCEVCERPFNSKHHVDSHMRTHTGDKPFTCEVCMKKFTQKNTLVVHRRIHTGEKPYSCQLCPKRFSNRKSFSVHTETHNRHARGKT